MLFVSAGDRLGGGGGGGANLNTACRETGKCFTCAYLLTFSSRKYFLDGKRKYFLDEKVIASSLLKKSHWFKFQI